MRQEDKALWLVSALIVLVVLCLAVGILHHALPRPADVVDDDPPDDDPPPFVALAGPLHNDRPANTAGPAANEATDT
jgi:hypothetical protein